MKEKPNKAMSMALYISVYGHSIRMKGIAILSILLLFLILYNLK